MFCVRDLCRSGCRQNFVNFYLTTSPLPPSLVILYAPTHNSLSNTNDNYLKSVRAGSVPFSSSHFVIGHLSRRPSCKAMKWDKVNTICRVCIVQYRIVLYYCGRSMLVCQTVWPYIQEPKQDECKRKVKRCLSANGLSFSELFDDISLVLYVKKLCVVVDSDVSVPPKCVIVCDFRTVLTGRTQSGIWSSI